MKRDHLYLRQSGVCLFSATLLAAASASAAKSPTDPVFPTDHRYLSEPLHICDQGSFFVGGMPKITTYSGRVEETDPEQIIIGQMYVQFQIPMEQRGWPLIHVHGSSHTGAALESTPDGREGWLPYGVRHGIPSYVVDQAGRARSGFDQSVINEGVRTGNVDMIPTIRSISNTGAWTNWFGHIIDGETVLDGTLIRHGDPGDPPDDDDTHTNDYLPAFPIPPVPNSIDRSIKAREGAIGPEPNPANSAYLALNYYKQLVPNTEDTLPSSFCPTCDPMEVEADNTWTPLALAELVEGLGGAIVATHSQSGIMGHHMARILKDRGKLHLLKGLITIEGGCSLAESGTTAADFADIPYLAVKGDYDEVSPDCAASVAAIQAAGGTAEYMLLDAPEFGGQFNGTTHMMMLGTNHLEVFDAMLDWTKENVPNPRKKNRHACH